ncbi:NO signaling/Golgi transport ligand-binding domain-containing protein [Amylocystis lapponica]|nr:NO signaling/Golgi transport ligand-binding domain-containing protein [Amylocystis lapponica]
MSSRTSFQAAGAGSAATSAASIPALAPLSDPPLRQMDDAAMDYFLIELVNTLRASTAVAAARARAVEHEMIQAGLIPAPAPPLPALRDVQRESMGSTTSRPAKGPADDEDEGLRMRLEAIGVHVGTNVAERLGHDRGLFSDTLDAVKFICKDLWAACWDKQVDNLRTNHRGIYVLQDNAFKPIARISGWEGRADAQRRAKLYVAMPAGIIRGALHRLGFHGAAVVPEITSLPQCTFQLKLPKSA